MGDKVYFCKKCGVRVSENDTTCSECGRVFDSVPEDIGDSYQCRECGNWFSHVDGNGLCGSCQTRFIAAAHYNSMR